MAYFTARGLKAWLIALVVIIVVIIVLIIIFNILILLLPIILILLVISYLFKVLNKFKKGKPKDYIDVKYKVKK